MLKFFRVVYVFILLFFLSHVTLVGNVNWHSVSYAYEPEESTQEYEYDTEPYTDEVDPYGDEVVEDYSGDEEPYPQEGDYPEETDPYYEKDQGIDDYSQEEVPYQEGEDYPNETDSYLESDQQLDDHFTEEQPYQDENEYPADTDPYQEEGQPLEEYLDEDIPFQEGDGGLNDYDDTDLLFQEADDVLEGDDDSLDMYEHVAAPYSLQSSSSGWWKFDKTNKKTPIKSRNQITLSLVKGIDTKVAFAYDPKKYHCKDQASNYALALMTGYYTNKGKKIRWEFYKQLKNNNIKISYDIKKATPGLKTKGWTSSVFIRPNDPDNTKTYYNPTQSLYMGMVDKLVYLPKGNTNKYTEGWYIKRQIFAKQNNKYKKVRDEFVTYNKLPVQIKNGDILYTAQAESGTGFQLRHAVFVVINGKKIDFFGAYPVEESGTGSLKLKVRDLRKKYGMSFVRRIIIKVWSPVY